MAELMRTRALSTAYTPLEVRLFSFMFFKKKRKSNSMKNISRGRTIELEHTRWKVVIDRIGSQAKGIYIFYIYVYLLISELISLYYPPRAHFPTPDDHASLSQKKMNALCTKNATAMAHD